MTPQSRALPGGAPTTTFAATTQNDFGASLAAADVNGDGFDDLLYTESASTAAVPAEPRRRPRGP